MLREPALSFLLFHGLLVGFELQREFKVLKLIQRIFENGGIRDCEYIDAFSKILILVKF